MQIGLTTTPRQLKISEKTEEARRDEAIRRGNCHHFGDPIHEYDMAQAMEDGVYDLKAVNARTKSTEDVPRAGGTVRPDLGQRGRDC